MINQDINNIAKLQDLLLNAINNKDYDDLGLKNRFDWRNPTDPIHFVSIFKGFFHFLSLCPTFGRNQI